MIEGRDEYISVAYLAGLGLFLDCSNDLFDEVVFSDHFKPYLRDKVDVVFGGAVKLDVAFFSSEPIHLGHRYPLDTDLVQGIFDFIELKELDGCFYPFYFLIFYGFRFEKILLSTIIFNLSAVDFANAGIRVGRDRQLKTSLVLEALRMAYWRQKPTPGLIYHSDRGFQYAAGDYQRQLEIFHMIPSMSRKGDCYDNAVAESFFHTL